MPPVSINMANLYTPTFLPWGRGGEQRQQETITM